MGGEQEASERDAGFGANRRSRDVRTRPYPPTHLPNASSVRPSVRPRARKMVVVHGWLATWLRLQSRRGGKGGVQIVAAGAASPSGGPRARRTSERAITWGCVVALVRWKGVLVFYVFYRAHAEAPGVGERAAPRARWADSHPSSFLREWYGQIML